MFVPSFHLIAPRRWLAPSALLLALSAACVPTRPAAEARAGNESEPGSLTVSGAQPTPGACSSMRRRLSGLKGLWSTRLGSMVWAALSRASWPNPVTLQ